VVDVSSRENLLDSGSSDAARYVLEGVSFLLHILDAELLHPSYDRLLLMNPTSGNVHVTENVLKT